MVESPYKLCDKKLYFLFESIYFVQQKKKKKFSVKNKEKWNEINDIEIKDLKISLLNIYS